jgi:hypothetical protein
MKTVSHGFAQKTLLKNPPLFSRISTLVPRIRHTTIGDGGARIYFIVVKLRANKRIEPRACPQRGGVTPPNTSGTPDKGPGGGAQLGPAHEGLPMVAPFTGKPGGWSRPGDAFPSARKSLGPAAHPQRYRDMKLHSTLFGWSDPDQALRVAAGILGERASGGLARALGSAARGAKPSRQCIEPGSLNPG